MSIWKTVSLVFLLSVLPVLAHAQPTSEVNPHEDVASEPISELPRGRFCETPGNGPTYVCLNVEEYAQLILLWEQAWYNYELATSVLTINNHLETVVGQLYLAIDAAEEQKFLLEQENERLYEKWVEENRLRHKAEAGSALDWLPWGLVAGEAAVILGIVLFAAVGG